MINYIKKNKNPILCSHNPIQLRCLMYKDKMICIQKGIYNGKETIEEKLKEYVILKGKLNEDSKELYDEASKTLRVEFISFDVGVDTTTSDLTLIPCNANLMEGEAYITINGKIVPNIPSSDYTTSEPYFRLINFNSKADRDDLIKNNLQKLKINKDLENELENHLDKMIAIFKREQLINLNKQTPSCRKNNNRGGDLD
ncbi:hypothetical protein [uncultured Clostridium sp.]|uniref:hypothetical protein n=1 Tax=uncultured Clostridium sp. TaxID=59620 RepID=UPI0026F381B8|nr:hypothetical protein [uncultured Clostridium sp.]